MGTYLGHALHVELDELGLVELQQRHPHAEDDLQPLREGSTLDPTPLPFPPGVWGFSPQNQTSWCGENFSTSKWKMWLWSLCDLWCWPRPHYLVHEDVEDTCGHGKREGGEEEGEEPGRGIHGGEEAL